MFNAVRKTCCALRHIAKNWSMRLFWSLLDMAHTNAFIIYRRFHPKVSHAAFFRMLAREMFYFAKGLQVPEKRVTRAHTKSPARISLCSDTDENSATESENDLSHHGQCIQSKLVAGYRRPCYACVRGGTFSEGTKRKTNDYVRKVYPRTSFGCKSCNVPLCTAGGCWQVYHQMYFGEQDKYTTGKWEL
jgi:hypothetical protein